MKQIPASVNYSLLLLSLWVSSGIVDGGRHQYLEPGTNTEFKQQTFNTRYHSAGQSSWKTLTGGPPVLSGHRGEPVLQPEHTIGSYKLASILGATYVEPDLVLTKDGYLVCFHDITLKEDTDVQNHEEFKDLMRNYTGIIDEDGPEETIVNDWFISDFTLSQLQKLKVVQSNIGIRPQDYNELFTIPTFQQFIDVIHEMSYKLNRPIGIIPELKKPYYHNRLSPESGKSSNVMEDKFLNQLRINGYPIKRADPESCKAKVEDKSINIPCSPIIIQSFEVSALKYLASQTYHDLLFLLDTLGFTAKYGTYRGVKELSNFVTYYSPWKEMLYTGIEAELKMEGESYDRQLIEQYGGFIPPQKFAEYVHSHQMKLGLYTIYDSREPSKRGCAIKCDPENQEEELNYYFDMGVDMLFVENIAEAREHLIRYEIKHEDEFSISSSLHKPASIISALIAISVLFNFNL